MLRLPKSVVNTKVKYLSFDFKWADHSTVDGNVMEFMDLGDAAPTVDSIFVSLETILITRNGIRQ